MEAMALPEEESEAESLVIKSMNQWASDSRLNLTSLRPRWREEKNDFKRGFAFDRAMLAGLKQLTVSARAVKWQAPIRFTGPLMSDVLALAKAQGRTITIHALDGYKQEFTPKELADRPWVLAITADGKPLGIGGRGPAWLVHATLKGKPATEDEEAKWVWSVFYMEAK